MRIHVLALLLTALALAAAPAPVEVAATSSGSLLSPKSVRLIPLLESTQLALSDTLSASNGTILFASGSVQGGPFRISASETSQSDSEAGKEFAPKEGNAPAAFLLHFSFTDPTSTWLHILETSSGTVRIDSLAQLPNNTVVVAGAFTGTSLAFPSREGGRILLSGGGTDVETIFVARLDASHTGGAFLWATGVKTIARDAKARSLLKGAVDVSVYEGSKSALGASKPEVQGDGTTDGKADGKSDGKADSKADGQVDGKAAGKADGQADGKADEKVDTKANDKVDAKLDVAGDEKVDAKATVTSSLVHAGKPSEPFIEKEEAMAATSIVSIETASNSAFLPASSTILPASKGKEGAGSEGLVEDTPEGASVSSSATVSSSVSIQVTSLVPPVVKDDTLISPTEGAQSIASAVSATVIIPTNAPSTSATPIPSPDALLDQVLVQAEKGPAANDNAAAASVGLGENGSEDIIPSDQFDVRAPWRRRDASDEGPENRGSLNAIFPVKICVDGNGDILVAGTYNGPLETSLGSTKSQDNVFDAFLLKVSTDSGILLSANAQFLGLQEPHDTRLQTVFVLSRLQTDPCPVAAGTLLITGQSYTFDAYARNAAGMAGTAATGHVVRLVRVKGDKSGYQHGDMSSLVLGRLAVKGGVAKTDAVTPSVGLDFLALGADKDGTCLYFATGVKERKENVAGEGLVDVKDVDAGYQAFAARMGEDFTITAKGLRFDLPVEMDGSEVRAASFVATDKSLLYLTGSVNDAKSKIDAISGIAFDENVPRNYLLGFDATGDSFSSKTAIPHPVLPPTPKLQLMPFPRLFASSLSSGNEMFAVAALRSETASSRGIWIGALDLHRVTAYAEGIVSAKGAAVDLKGGKAGDEKKKPVASETPPQESKKVSPDTAEKGKDVETPVSGNPDGGKDATKPIQKPVAGEVNGGTDATKPIKMPESEDKSKQPIKKPVTVNDSKGSIPPPIKKPAETIDKKLPETGGEGVVSEGGTVPIKKPFSDEDKDLPPNKPPQDDDEEDMVAAPSFEEPLNDDDGVGFKPSGQAMGDSSVYHEESSEEYKHVKTSVEDASFNGSGFLVVLILVAIVAFILFVVYKARKSKLPQVDVNNLPGSLLHIFRTIFDPAQTNRGAYEPASKADDDLEASRSHVSASHSVHSTPSRGLNPLNFRKQSVDPGSAMRSPNDTGLPVMGGFTPGRTSLGANGRAEDISVPLTQKTNDESWGWEDDDFGATDTPKPKKSGDDDWGW